MPPQTPCHPHKDSLQVNFNMQQMPHKIQLQIEHKIILPLLSLHRLQISGMQQMCATQAWGHMYFTFPILLQNQ